MGTVGYISAQIGTVGYISAQIGTVGYISAQIGTVRYISAQIGTVRYISVQLVQFQYIYLCNCSHFTFHREFCLSVTRVEIIFWTGSTLTKKLRNSAKMGEGTE